MVTILILVDGFLQLYIVLKLLKVIAVTILILVDGFLQSFRKKWVSEPSNRHNPYFSRWFSAIYMDNYLMKCTEAVTILILVDGFLQFKLQTEVVKRFYVSQSLF